jgi:predicted metal-dependent phosphoesterase TrpH
MIDLHTHSTASDGSLSPEALVDAAREKGLAALALTDHDTTAGLAQARAQAERQGLRFIPGVELEIDWPGDGEFHLLGLGIGSPGPAMARALQALQEGRERRNREIFARMAEFGIPGSLESLKAAGGIIGRPHIADMLVAQKLAKNREQAFQRYLGAGRPLYFRKPGLSLDEALAAIHEAGGIAVLAHPLSLYVSWGRLPGLLRSLREQGIDGIEAWHPSAKPRASRRLEAAGRALGFLISAGSDFHGAGRPERRLGYCGSTKIDDSFLEILP